MANANFITVTLPNYRVPTHGVDLPTGHAGFIVTDGSGTATYYEYGLYQPDTFTNVGGSSAYNPNGAIRSLTLTGLQYDSSGNVTQQSLQSALDQVFGTSGMYHSDTGMVIASAFKITSNQVNDINDFVAGQVSNIAAGAERYSILNGNDCENFCLNAATSAGLTVASGISSSGPGIPFLAANDILQSASLSYQYFGPNSWKGASSILPISGSIFDANSPQATLNSIEDAAVQAVNSAENSALSLRETIYHSIDSIYNAVHDGIISPSASATTIITSDGLNIGDSGQIYKFQSQTGENINISNSGLSAIVDVVGGNTFNVENGQTVIDAGSLVGSGVSAIHNDHIISNGGTIIIADGASAAISSTATARLASQIIASNNTTIIDGNYNDAIAVTGTDVNLTVGGSSLAGIIHGGWRA